MDFEIKEIDVIKDERGWLAEIFKKSEIDNLVQVYFFVAKPKVMRGSHYHKRKTEWFCVIKGVGELVLMDMDTKETKKIEMNDAKPCLVKIPPGIAHKITNVGDEDLYVLAHIDEEFDESDPDTFKVEF